MNSPVIIESDSFQDVWEEAIQKLQRNHWELWDIVVKINAPLLLDEAKHQTITAFAKRNNLILPDQVAYTIFPIKLFKRGRSFEEICKGYWKYFNMTRHMAHSGWGTYFERMIRYPTADGTKNQLGKIIASINTSTKIQRAAYTMVIPKPGWENVRMMGAPCLNYVAIREEPSPRGRTINLLAVYRNHDFLERAYGNYYGLCKLLEYIAFATNSQVGSLTCISSHAFVEKKRTNLSSLIAQL